MAKRRADREASSIRRSEETLLRYLARYAPVLIRLPELFIQLDTSRQTLGKMLRRLIKLDLAARPLGERAGATITAKGRALLDSLPPLPNGSGLP